MNAVLKLKERQDLFSLVLGILFPTEDKLEIDVYMKEGSMPQTVLAIATKKAMRAMLAEETGEDGMHSFQLQSLVHQNPNVVSVLGLLCFLCCHVSVLQSS